VTAFEAFYETIKDVILSFPGMIENYKGQITKSNIQVFLFSGLAGVGEVRCDQTY